MSALRHEFTHRALGARFRVVVYCPDRPAAGRAEAAVIRRLAELEEIFDESRPTSELAQAYANAGIGTVRVSNDLLRLLRELEKLGTRSRGAFDVTAGASAERWRQSVESGVLPAPEDLPTTRDAAGADTLRLDAIARTIHIANPETRLDLATVVPGYACDRVLGALRTAGFPSALVDGGGRIAVGDPPPGRDAWLVEVNNAPRKAAHRVIPLNRQAIASTGPVAEAAVVIEGGRYSRVLDPRTGLGAQRTSPVTAVARRAWQADVLARAASVLGATDTRPLIRVMPDAKVWFHGSDGDGE